MKYSTGQRIFHELYGRGAVVVVGVRALIMLDCACNNDQSIKEILRRFL